VKVNDTTTSQTIIAVKSSPKKKSPQKQSPQKKSPIKSLPSPVTKNITKPRKQQKQVKEKQNNVKQKQKELWVVNTPKATAPIMTSPFVARKSKPVETVSFHIPAGYKLRDAPDASCSPPVRTEEITLRTIAEINKESKASSVFQKVDELFHNFFPTWEDNSDKQSMNETKQDMDIETSCKEDQKKEEPASMIGSILDEVMAMAVSTSLEKCEHQNIKDSSSTSIQDKAQVPHLDDKLKEDSIPLGLTEQSTEVGDFLSTVSVFCNGTEALLNTEKYVAGSGGKCVLYQAPDIVPKLFMNLSGSKSKNYKKTIKCEGKELGQYLEQKLG
jgi:hypothetical protein